MAWEYVLRDSLRMPPCPRCGALLDVVRLKGTIYVCMDCGRKPFEATWRAEPAALPAAGERERTG